MSISEVRSIPCTIDANGCGIVREVYIRPIGRRRPDAARGSVVRRGDPRSGAQIRDAGLVRESLDDDRAQPLADRLVRIEVGQPAEEEKLLDREVVPASIEIDLG